MRLKPEEISFLVTKILAEWKKSGYVTFTGPEDNLHRRLEEIFHTDLGSEENLNAEVEKVLAKYEKEFAKGTLDRRKMFQMVKAQLAKDKKVVL